ncbi:MAG TPA: hypothetical protein DIU15_14245 [Deltaproteobacteria bacterium]|nr:hypothetical protein [Deltaproteobacteria bacterium]HCP47199.1 hypothetical protein [Deltaproteobacteria bacterium]|tara:strand:- start:1596 stop:1847 length:252 start_codon:yes stop_codon:yes gene_type:complete
MQTLSHYDLTELKLIYRVLHSQLMDHLDLMDAQLFEDMQTWLQTVARKEGVDVSDHKQWDAWLGDEQTKEDHIGRHRTLTLVG